MYRDEPESERARERRRFHQLARVHNSDPLAGLRDDPEIVGDQEDRRARFFTEVAEQIEDARGDRYVETGGWLVGDEKPRRGGERHRDHDALAHAARKLMRILLHAPYRIGHADKIEKLQRAPARAPRASSLREFQRDGKSAALQTLWD